jgi:phage terminase large subunit-like protein
VITAAKPGVAAVEAFAARVGLELEPFQKKIVRAVLGPQREVLILLPRGQGKTTLMGLLTVHHLLEVDDARVYVAASSRDQARILFEAAEGFARGLGDEHVVYRHLELRWCPDPEQPTSFTRYLRVLPAEGPRLHGLTPTLMVWDEAQAVSREDVYPALASALHKHPLSKLVTISTAGQGAESPLGQLRRRALALPSVKRRGALTDAEGPGMRMLDWSVPDTEELVPARVKKANPASWISTDLLREQQQRLPELAFRRFIANQWTERAGHWLPPGAWQSCVGEPRFEDGEPILIGVDVGGERSSSAVVWLNERLHVGCEIFHGEGGVLECVDLIRELGARYRVVEVAFDPWRFGQAAQELEREGVRVVAFAQSDSRMIPASSRLHAAVTEQRLVLPDHPELTKHAADMIARHSRRGWRVDKPTKETNVDAIVALCMALDRLEDRPPEVKVLGWV